MGCLLCCFCFGYLFGVVVIALRGLVLLVCLRWFEAEVCCVGGCRLLFCLFCLGLLYFVIFFGLVIWFFPGSCD